MERLDQQMSTLSARSSTNLVGRTSDLTSSMAMKLTYKRFAFLFLPVVAAVIAPPLLSLLLIMLNFITKGHALATIVLSAGYTTMLCMKIKELAPSQQKASEALQNRSRIFGISFCFAAMFCRSFLSVYFPRGGDGNGSNYFVHCGALSLGILFLSVLVASRFVGPCGIAQCSTYPLPHNPYEKVIYNLSSFQRILDQLVAPDNNDPANSNMQNSKILGKEGPKRYKSPLLIKSIIQIFLHIFCGALFAQALVAPILRSHNVNEFVIRHTTFCCSILSSLTFVTTYMTSTNYHELPPKSQHPGMIFGTLWKQIQSSGFLFYWIITPPLCMLGSFWYSGGSLTVVTMAHALTVSLPTTFLMSLYIMISDIALRGFLMQPGVNVNRFIREARSEDCEIEDVLVESILCGMGRDVLEYIISPRLIIDRDGKIMLPTAPKRRGLKIVQMQNTRDCNLEEEELIRNDAMTLLIKHAIERGQICGHISLEDELMKFCFLESFGGSSTNLRSDTPLGLSPRHYNSIMLRIESSDGVLPGGAQSALVPVLRAMCAYIGAIGMALSGSAKNFYVSPCLKSTVEYTALAACRFIVLNMVGKDSHGNTRKRYNRISILVPIVMESIYRLRTGFFDLGNHLHEREMSTKKVEPKFIIQNYQGALPKQTFEDDSIEHIINVCDESAGLILKALKDVDGVSDFGVAVRSQSCKEWLNSLK